MCWQAKQWDKDGSNVAGRALDSEFRRACARIKVNNPAGAGRTTLDATAVQG